jgi:hypothetical protein
LPASTPVAALVDDDTKKDAKVTCTDDSNGGTFTLSLVATDDDGASSIASTANLTVLNLKPVASAAAYSGNEGSAIGLSGSADDLATTTIPPHVQVVNTTGIDANGQCVRRRYQERRGDLHRRQQERDVYPQPGRHGRRRQRTASTTTLAVLNVDPVADAGGSYSGNEGSPVQQRLGQRRRGNDTFTWSWVSLNGPAVDAGAACSFSDIHADPTVTCTDDGEFKLTLTVRTTTTVGTATMRRSPCRT